MLRDRRPPRTRDGRHSQQVTGLAQTTSLTAAAVLMFVHAVPRGTPTARTAGRLASFVLSVLAGLALANLPALDLIDRCRPSGTGLCIDGRHIDTVCRVLWLKQALLWTGLVATPLVLLDRGMDWLVRPAASGAPGPESG